MLRYHVFLSYISEDSEMMWRVYHALQIEGLNVWIDQTNLDAGTLAWDRAIEDAIVNSGCVVVILSPRARDSEWVREELHYAKQLGKRIYPLLAAGEAHNAIPFGFSTAQWTDIRDELRLHEGLHKITGTICKNLGVESRSQRRERIQAERDRAESMARQHRAVDEAQQQADALTVQREWTQQEFGRVSNEEKELRLRLEFITLQHQKLQQELSILIKQEKQAKHFLMTLLANFKAMQEDIAIADDPVPPPRYTISPEPDWASELPTFAALADEDDETAVWYEADMTHPTAPLPRILDDRRALPPPRGTYGDDPVDAKPRRRPK